MEVGGRGWGGEGRVSFLRFNAQLTTKFKMKLHVPGKAKLLAVGKTCKTTFLTYRSLAKAERVGRVCVWGGGGGGV